MDQHWVFYAAYDVEELLPDGFLIVGAIGPKAVLNDRVARFDADTDQIVGVAVGQAFDIQINRCAVDLQFRASDM